MATDAVVQTATDERIADQVRRYTVRLAVCLIIGVNALFLLVLWGSGVDLDQIFAERDFFDPTSDICLRMAWYKPLGEQDPVRLCKEWLNLGDPSGRVHQFNKDLQVVKGADGKVYAKEGAGDGRLIAVVIIVVLLVASGMWLQRHLIARYRAPLGAAGMPWTRWNPRPASWSPPASSTPGPARTSNWTASGGWTPPSWKGAR